MRGRIVEADFVEDTLTMKMDYPYYAQAAMFVLVPIDEYEAMTVVADSHAQAGGA